MLTDFNDIWWECTWLYSQQTGVRGVFLSLHGLTVHIQPHSPSKVRNLESARCRVRGIARSSNSVEGWHRWSPSNRVEFHDWDSAGQSAP